MMAYHTAMKTGQVVDAPAVGRAEFPDGIALQHDLFDPLPAEYEACSVIYADPPWRHGYDVFNERAGASAPEWSVFMRRVGEVIDSTPTPIVLCMGSTAMRYVPRPTVAYQTTLNGAKAILACWRVTVDNHATAESALDELCQRHDVIGDFCAGYGRTAIVARAHGKRFVVSDHNATCIGYMAGALAA